VVSSLNAPSLFLIAKDLTRIQVWVSVNEADIGHIHPGQPVSFTVDAFPGRVFHGQVGKTRLNATMTQNVVTYTVEVTTDNLDGKLLPYLTANVKFDSGTRQNVLVVPNAALRWRPQPNQIAPEFRQTAPDGSRKPGRASQGESQSDGRSQTRGTIWVQQGQFVRPVQVSVGLTDNTVTEVQGENLAEGAEVVVGDQTQETAAAARTGAGASPFTPQLGRRNAAQGGESGGRPAGGR
jgi:HlyD family secretion protein